MSNPNKNDVFEEIFFNKCKMSESSFSGFLNFVKLLLHREEIEIDHVDGELISMIVNKVN